MPLIVEKVENAVVNKTDKIYLLQVHGGNTENEQKICILRVGKYYEKVKYGRAVRSTVRWLSLGRRRDCNFKYSAQTRPY